MHRQCLCISFVSEFFFIGGTHTAISVNICLYGLIFVYHQFNISIFIFVEYHKFTNTVITIPVKICTIIAIHIVNFSIKFISDNRIFFSNFVNDFYNLFQHIVTSYYITLFDSYTLSYISYIVKLNFLKIFIIPISIFIQCIVRQFAKFPYTIFKLFNALQIAKISIGTKIVNIFC